ncbi:MAG: DUF2933 domain-containing protein [Candidatus Methylomirabilia bacterium]
MGEFLQNYGFFILIAVLLLGCHLGHGAHGRHGGRKGGDADGGKDESESGHHH